MFGVGGLIGGVNGGQGGFSGGSASSGDSKSSAGGDWIQTTNAQEHWSSKLVPLATVAGLALTSIQLVKALRGK